MPQLKPKLINCPQCGKPAVYGEDNRFRPFCSERCKMIDLGHWAAEDYRVISSPQSDGTPMDDNSN